MKVTTIESYLKNVYSGVNHVGRSGLSLRKIKKKFPSTYYIRTSHSVETTVLAWKDGCTVWYHVLIHKTTWKGWWNTHLTAVITYWINELLIEAKNKPTIREKVEI